MRWLAWRRLVSSSSPSATIPLRTALSRDFAARKREEFAASADRRKVAVVILAMNTREEPAKYFPGGRVKFDEAGRRVDADLAIAQWQDGVPVTVYPTASALAKLIWPKN